MHEYILYSQIPASRESQILNILTGVTALQPVPIREQTLIFAQTSNKAAEAAVSRKNVKQQQSKQTFVPNYHKLVRDVHLKDGALADSGPWRFRAEQVPEPGIQAFISRAVIEHPATDAEMTHFQDPEWYRYQQQYIIMGSRFVLDDVVVRIFRFHAPTTAPMPDVKAADLIQAPPLSPFDLKLLDRSGSWVVESVVRIEDGASSSVTDKAKEELIRFQSRMDGAIDLFAPDRLALDTRVRGT